MNRKLFYIKRIFIFLGLGFLYLASKLFKKIFARKTFLFVSRTGIRSYSVGFVGQVAIVYCLFWLGNLFFQSLAYDSIIKSKSEEIENLEEANNRFKKEVYLLNESLVKINEYFMSISSYTDVSAKEEDGKNNIKNKLEEIFGNLSLNGNDRETAEKIADSNVMLDNIKDVARNRIEDLERKISITGLSLSNQTLAMRDNATSTKPEEDQQITEISLNNNGELRKRQGGPFQKLKNDLINKSKKLVAFNGVDIRDEISYLSDLEVFIHRAPLAKPMKNYYVSSGFGKRTDPMHGGAAVHGGMDFVGHQNEPIIAPSAGRVSFIGKFGAYGNAVVIDHGYGITTRYGHLSKIKVAKDQTVKKGDVIAFQGSTGRSTGPHLHYEVRYRNTPLNPKKFLQAGQEIFNDESSVKNVDI